MENSGLRGLSWELCCCKIVFGTFFFERWSAKILEPEISQSMGATQRWKHDAGNQKLWEIPGIRGLSPEPSSANLVRDKLANGNFCEAWAPRRVGRTTRGAKNNGKFRDSCVCGAAGANALSTEEKG